MRQPADPLELHENGRANMPPLTLQIQRLGLTAAMADGRQPDCQQRAAALGTNLTMTVSTCSRIGGDIAALPLGMATATRWYPVEARRWPRRNRSRQTVLTADPGA